MTLDNLSYAPSAKAALHLAKLAMLFAHPGVKSFGFHDNIDRVQTRWGSNIDFRPRGYSVHESQQPMSMTVQVHVSDIYIEEHSHEYNIVLNALHAANKTSAPFITLPFIPGLLPSASPVLDALYARGTDANSVHFLFTIETSRRNHFPNPPRVSTTSCDLRALNVHVGLYDALRLFRFSVSTPLTKLDLKLSDLPMPAGLREKYIRCIITDLTTLAPNLIECRITIGMSFIIPKNGMANGIEGTVIATRVDYVPEQMSIMYETLKRLGACTKLEHLEVRDIYPMSIETSEMENLMEMCPRLTTFVLGYSSLDAVGMWHETSTPNGQQLVQKMPTESNGGGRKSLQGNWREGLKGVTLKILEAVRSNVMLRSVEIPLLQRPNVGRRRAVPLVSGFDGRVLKDKIGEDGFVYKLILSRL
ncbi:hypothetical protein V5O48_007496 [Marasmius crinis-equi]|uniref:Uncharacterized protein n=1 Tax=Marasmius crinis-equi TaxID=585013 RepID=A0ABR3FGZ6_9AGAR